MKENIEVAKRGGKVARNTIKDLEKELGESVVSACNNLNYEYIENKKSHKK